MLTPLLKQLVINIDNCATQILSQGGDEALLTSLYPLMGDIKQILDAASRLELDGLCEQYDGFYRCVKLLEKLASGIAEGSIPKIPSEEKEQLLSRVCQNDYVLKPEWVTRYQQIRESLQKLHGKFMVSLTRESINRCARQLEIAAGDSLLLNTEHEMNVFFDYCLFQSYQSNSNAIQKSFKRFAGRDTKAIAIFNTMANGYFAYLQILAPVGEVGLVVFDLERKTEHLMIDKGLSQAAKSQKHYTIVTHVINFNDFIITTGASTPVDIDTTEGKKLHQRYEEFAHETTLGKVSLKNHRQYVTDLYKICLHEDITGKVSSPTLPFGRQIGVVASDTSH